MANQSTYFTDFLISVSPVEHPPSHLLVSTGTVSQNKVYVVIFYVEV